MAGISAEELAKVKADPKYKHLRDIDAAIRKWYTKSIKRGWPVTFEKLEQFLAREKQRPAKAGAKKKNDPARRADHSAADAESLEAQAAQVETERQLDEQARKLEYMPRLTMNETRKWIISHCPGADWRNVFFHAIAIGSVIRDGDYYIGRLTEPQAAAA
jgi:hypothetical protein